MAGEARLESYFKRRVRELGGHTRKVRWLCRRGAPDRLVWWEFPAAGLVELKDNDKEVDPRSLQAREVRTLRQTGWPVFVCNSKESIDAALDKIRGAC